MLPRSKRPRKAMIEQQSSGEKTMTYWWLTGTHALLIVLEYSSRSSQAVSSW
jgi:hypothetical protein